MLWLQFLVYILLGNATRRVHRSRRHHFSSKLGPFAGPRRTRVFNFPNVERNKLKHLYCVLVIRPPVGLADRSNIVLGDVLQLGALSRLKCVRILGDQTKSRTPACKGLLGTHEGTGGRRVVWSGLDLTHTRTQCTRYGRLNLTCTRWLLPRCRMPALIFMAASIMT